MVSGEDGCGVGVTGVTGLHGLRHDVNYVKLVDTGIFLWYGRGVVWNMIRASQL